MFEVHRSPFSGSWYPSAAAELERLLDDAFAASQSRAPYLFPGALGLVVPHAGPAYSGTVAAAAYRVIERQQPERIVLLAFPHRGGLNGVAAPAVGAIGTPLGEVAIDPGFGEFAQAPEERLCDHSFEIQLPFLQRSATGARITPLYVGRMRGSEREEAAEKLARLWRPGVVFVASSDFTHFGRTFGFTPFPADRMAADRLRELDFECIDAAATLDPLTFLDTLERNGATVCGSAPISLLLATLRRLGAGLYQSTLDYQTSGEITGDFQHSVSYAALGFYPARAFELDAAAREALLDSAAATLRHARVAGERLAIPAADASPALRARLGLFVSLRRGDDLLGCIGELDGRVSLAEDVAAMTLSAALEDARFKPAASVKGPIDIEISALTPFRRIARAEDCRAGRHGLLLRLGGRAGLLLPQVAAERGWTTEEFLQAVCRKTGVGPNAWKDPEARLYIFEAQVFARRKAVE